MDKRTTSLLNEFDLMETERRKIYHARSAEDPINMKQPADGGWNVCGVAQHLFDAERNALAYMRKKMGGGDVSKAGLGSLYRYTLLKIALLLPIKYKAPKLLKEPDPNKPFSVVLAEWDALRTEMREFLANIPPDKIGLELFKHPAAGKISLRQAVQFMHTHQRHHDRQVQRIIKG